MRMVPGQWKLFVEKWSILLRLISAGGACCAARCPELADPAVIKLQAFSLTQLFVVNPMPLCNACPMSASERISDLQSDHCQLRNWE